MHFFIIGAQKAASTSLQSALEECAEFFLVPGELGLFEAPDYAPERADLYIKRALEQAKERKLGAKRPNLLGEPAAIDRLIRHCPQVRLIVILRDPSTRAFSALLHFYRYGLIPLGDPNATLRAGADRYPDLPKLEHSIFSYGLYGEALAGLRERHPSVPVLVVREASYRAPGEALSQGVAEFLQVPSLRIRESKRRNVGARSSVRLHYFAIITRLCFSGPDQFERLHLRHPKALFRFAHRSLAAIDSRLLSRFIKGNPMRLDDETRDRLRAFYQEDQEKLDRLLESGSFTVL